MWVDVDELSVSMVVDEAMSIALQGADRHEAVRRMAEKGIPWREQGRRLQANHSTLNTWATHNGVKLNPNPPAWVRKTYY